MSDFWEKRTVLVTGGGSLGSELVEQLLKLPIHATRVLDVAENALYELLQRFGHNDRLRFLQGDVRNKDRVRLALDGVDYVIHTAALKSVDIAGANPLETISVNVDGTSALIQECLRSKVQRAIMLSSDKAIISTPNANVYHATKFLVEKITLWANSISNTTRFACIRPANFVPSRMSVFETWYSQHLASQPLTVTSLNASRYFIPLQSAAKATLKALTLMEGGEVFIPDARSYKISELVRNSGQPYDVVGLREGDRMTEDLMSPDEQARATRIDGMWVLRS